jgi:hypothetical protein
MELMVTADIVRELNREVRAYAPSVLGCAIARETIVGVLP